MLNPEKGFESKYAPEVMGGIDISGPVSGKVFPVYNDKVCSIFCVGPHSDGGMILFGLGTLKDNDTTAIFGVSPLPHKDIEDNRSPSITVSESIAKCLNRCFPIVDIFMFVPDYCMHGHNNISDLFGADIADLFAEYFVGNRKNFALLPISHLAPSPRVAKGSFGRHLSIIDLNTLLFTGATSNEAIHEQAGYYE